MQEEIYYKELIHAIMETGISKICRVVWQTRDPGNLGVQIQSEGQQAGDSDPLASFYKDSFDGIQFIR